MRQKEINFIEGIVWIFFFLVLQTLLGKWMLWSRIMPEADFVLLLLFALGLGRLKGMFLGLFTGTLRDLFSIHSFGGGAVVLGLVGFFAGHLGKRHRPVQPLQKLVFIFAAFLFSDVLLTFLSDKENPISVPSATLNAVVGFFMGYLF